MARPPSTYEGRTSTGYPMRSRLRWPLRLEVAITPGACGICSSSSSLSKRLRSSARSIDSGEVPMMLTPAAFSGRARLSGVWPPNCTITPTRRALRRFVLVDGEHIFERKRLEVETVAGVVVGGDGLRIAVDHDGLVAVLAQRERGVAAAVIEFNSLPDAVGPAAENDDFLLVGGRGLVFVFVGGIEIGREAFELRGAGIDALVDRPSRRASCAGGELFPGRLCRPDARFRRDARRRSPCAWPRAAPRSESIPSDAFPAPAACR